MDISSCNNMTDNSLRALGRGCSQVTANDYLTMFFTIHLSSACECEPLLVRDDDGGGGGGPGRGLSSAQHFHRQGEHISSRVSISDAECRAVSTLVTRPSTSWSGGALDCSLSISTDVAMSKMTGSWSSRRIVPPSGILN